MSPQLGAAPASGWAIPPILGHRGCPRGLKAGPPHPRLSGPVAINESPLLGRGHSKHRLSASQGAHGSALLGLGHKSLPAVTNSDAIPSETVNT